MSRPFRLQPPHPMYRVVARHRLGALLAQRWERRLTVLEAGPGFGKTAALVAALNTNTDDCDVWLSCEPADHSPDHLLAGLAAAVGATLAVEPTAGVSGICDAVWSAAPRRVCLVLDDVHEIPPASGGATVLAQLVDELPANGHVAMASRRAVPVSTARLATQGQLLQIHEGALAFDHDDLVAFAAARGVDVALLDSTSGWPALAELTASAGTELVLRYPWEEVLARLGPERVRDLALLEAVGGGDDSIVRAVTDRGRSVEELIDGVPLARRAGDWVALHPLWEPALRGVLEPGHLAAARVAAGEVHLANGRLAEAVDLFVQAGDWARVLLVMHRCAIEAGISGDPSQLLRFARQLPAELQGEPEALLAVALDLGARAPSEAPAAFQRAAAAFRDRHDEAGELAAIAQEGLVRWWAGDVVGLFGLYQRVVELAEHGSTSARGLNAVCLAAIAHLGGDSAGVHQQLAGLEMVNLGVWYANALWLRSVAYRRDGDLDNARRELARLPTNRGSGSAGDHAGLQARLANLRTDWLDGHVDRVGDELAVIARAYELSGERVLAYEALLETACKSAWIGETELSEDLLSRAQRLRLAERAPLHDTLVCIALTSQALVVGGESDAARELAPQVDSAVTGPTAWYWGDRAALSLVYVLAPHTRDALLSAPMAPVHRVAVEMASVLIASRSGDLGPARTMRWPGAGVARANLPVSWLAELVAVGHAVHNPPEKGLVELLGAPARSALRIIAAEHPHADVRASALRARGQIPAPPAFRLQINVLGPLEVRCDGEVLDTADIRRQRVRELISYMAVHRTVRREEMGSELWPDAADPGHNLRVTLNYTQRLLQPSRSDGDPPYFLRSQGPVLELAASDELEVDLWQLEAALRDADAAERRPAPGTALEAYRSVLDVWRGEPFYDLPYAQWAVAPRERLRRRFVAAALRAGELLLAIDDHSAAANAARRAIAADRYDEAAYRLLIRTCLRADDVAAAQLALGDCRSALRELDRSPTAETESMIGTGR